MIEIGLFSAGLITTQSPGNVVLEDLVKIVPKAEKLGFKRFWLGEHYEGNCIWRNPEILLTLLAGMTSTIRVGAAGVLLNAHRPLLVAQNFKLMGYLFDERIDLGLARGLPTAGPLKALIGSDQVDTFESKVTQLLEYLYQLNLPADITIPPYYHGGPQIWLMGKSCFDLAIQYHASICISLMHQTKFPLLPHELETFRDRYIEKWQHEPNILVAVAGIAMKSRKSTQAIKASLTNNFFIPSIIGNASDCHDQIMELCQKFKLSEIVFMDLCQDISEKLECYSLLSQIFHLKDNKK